MLLFVGYCLFQHYKSFALLRLLYLRQTEQGEAGELYRAEAPSIQGLIGPLARA